MYRPIFTIASLLAFIPFVHADDWPGFRGPHGDGTIDVRGLPGEWSEKQNLAWKMVIPGDAWSSPIVWGDRLIVTSAVTDEKTGDIRWEVRCLDPGTGTTRWSRVAAQGKAPIPIHNNNTYASETPVTDGRRIYAYFGMKGLYCFDMDGKPLWNKSLGAFPTVNDMGTASSPALADGRLFILCENVKMPFLAAFKAETGAELWRKERPSKSSWSTPYLWRNRQRTELVACGSGVVQSFDPASGKLLWEMTGLPGKFTATPVGNKDLLFVGAAGATDDGFLFAVKAGASGALTLPGDKGANEGIAWTRTRSGPGMASALLAGEHLYVFHRRFVNCHDAKTGERLYRERLPNAGNFLASPWFAAGKVYALDEAGTTYVLKAGPRFELLGKNTIFGMFWTSPAIMDGAIYLRAEGNLYCVRSP